MKRVCRFLAVLVVFLASAGCFAVPAGAAPKCTFVVSYQAITEVGSYEEMNLRVPKGQFLIRSSDGRTGYLVKHAKVRDEAHLRDLMGLAPGTSDQQLSRSQRVLLETYRGAKTGYAQGLQAHVPFKKATIELELTDTEGYDSRFPQMKDDFWPRNQKWRAGETDESAGIQIKISPVFATHFHESLAKEARATFFHEFGHSLDLTERESDGYGADGHHYLNEMVKERAAFVEGFANFIALLGVPALEKDYREATAKILYEGPGGNYMTMSAKSLKGPQLLKVEGINALILFRLAGLPEGRNKVFAAFRESNNQYNTIGNLLKVFVRQNPDLALEVSRILDQETLGRMSPDQIRELLGDSAGVEDYLNRRASLFTGTGGKAASPGTPTSPQDASKAVKTEGGGADPFTESGATPKKP